MTRAVAYARVSTDKQADLGVSLEAQESKLRAYAALYDIELAAIEVDAGESASTLDRPALQRALTMVRKKQVDALLVVKLDRLTRSVRDLADLVERYFKRAALLSVAEQVDTRTAGGRMVLNVMTSIGQWEREAIGERTSAAMSHLRDSGRRHSRWAPYGAAYEADGGMVPQVAELVAIEQARALRAQGLSLRAVSSMLAERGILARCGRPFGAQTLARILQREPGATPPP